MTMFLLLGCAVVLPTDFLHTPSRASYHQLAMQCSVQTLANNAHRSQLICPDEKSE